MICIIVWVKKKQQLCSWKKCPEVNGHQAVHLNNTKESGKNQTNCWHGQSLIGNFDFKDSWKRKLTTIINFMYNSTWQDTSANQALSQRLFGWPPWNTSLPVFFLNTNVFPKYMAVLHVFILDSFYWLDSNGHNRCACW